MGGARLESAIRPYFSMPNDKELNQLGARIEDLVRRVENIADPAVRANVVTLLQSLLELHGQAFGRMLDLLSQQGQSGHAIIDRLAQDDLVAGLLLLYDIHPDGLRTRVQKAVTEMQPQIRASGGSVELIGVEDGAVRVRLTANGNGCGSGALEKTVRDFIYASAPDVSHIDVEKIEKIDISSGLVQLQVNAGAGPA